MEILRQFTYGFFSTLGFAILFQAPKKSLITNGIIGGIGWIVYKYLMLNGYSILFSAMVASIIIGSISAITSVFIKMPAITFFAPSIIPLVPGGGMYYTMYYLIMQETDKFGAKALETTLTALAIAMGIFLSVSTVNTIRSIYYSIKYKC